MTAPEDASNFLVVNRKVVLKAQSRLVQLSHLSRHRNVQVWFLLTKKLETIIILTGCGVKNN
ncbi:MAG: hypothetical protein ACN4GW_21435 [Desulforhopalus sp.]